MHFSHIFYSSQINSPPWVCFLNRVCTLPIINLPSTINSIAWIWAPIHSILFSGLIKCNISLDQQKKREIFTFRIWRNKGFPKSTIYYSRQEFLSYYLRYSALSQTFNITPWCSKYCCSHTCFTMFNPSNKTHISSHNSNVQNMFYYCVPVIVSTENLKERVKINDL